MEASTLDRLISKVVEIATEPEDSATIRLQKTLLLGACFFFIPVVIPWIFTHLIYGEVVAAAISTAYLAFSSISVIVYLQTRRFSFLLRTQQLLILLSPFLFMLALGGINQSSAVILWSVICPLGTLIISEPRQARYWMLAFLGILILSGILQPFLPTANDLPPSLIITFFVLNIGVVSTFIFILLYYFVQEKDKAYRLLNLEQEKSERLLLNVLPKEIAPILKDENRTIADRYGSASVLFADVVDFTPLSAAMTPEEMVNLLNEIFSQFDSLVEKYDLEKIRTIGDNYMVAAGVPRPRHDHAVVLADMALEMRDYILQRPERNGRRIDFRVGMNTGPLVAGVIGRQKFHYDVWGDTVNLASRMESQGIAGKIQITPSMYESLKDDFLCEPRGAITVKGRGEMQTWFLVGRKF